MKTLKQHISDEKLNSEYIPGYSTFSDLVKLKSQKFNWNNTFKYLRYSFLVAIAIFLLFQIPNIVNPRPSLVGAAENIQKVIEGIFNDNKSILHEMSIQTVYSLDGKVESIREYELYRDNSVYERFNRKIVTELMIDDSSEIEHQINNGDIKYEYSSAENTLRRTRYVFKNPEDKNRAIESMAMVGLPQMLEAITYSSYSENLSYEVITGDGFITIVEYLDHKDAYDIKTEYVFNSATYMPIKSIQYYEIDKSYVLYQTVETIALEILPRSEENLTKLFDINSIKYDSSLVEIVDDELIVEPIQ